MAADRTTQDKLLRTVYQDRLRLQFNVNSILMQKIGRKPITAPEGSAISVPLHSSQTGGYGWLAKAGGGTLPTAGEQGITRASFNHARLYGRIEVDGAHMEEASSRTAAEESPFVLESVNMIKQMRSALNFDLFQDGSGALSVLSGASTNNTPAAGQSTLPVANINGFNKNQVVDVKATTDGSEANGAAGATVLAVNIAAKTIVLDTNMAGAGANTTESVYRQGSRNIAVSGLKGIVSDTNPSSGNYGGIDRSVTGNEYWKAHETDHGAVVITLKAIANEMHHVDRHSNGRTNLIITSYPIWGQVIDLLLADKRFDGQRMKLNGWLEAVTFVNIPIVPDKHCDDDRMYLLDTTSFKFHQKNEGAWMQEDGAILSRVANKHAYEATWFRFLELVCDAPNKNAVIKNIQPTL